MQPWVKIRDFFHIKKKILLTPKLNGSVYVIFFFEFFVLFCRNNSIQVWNDMRVSK